MECREKNLPDTLKVVFLEAYGGADHKPVENLAVWPMLIFSNCLYGYDLSNVPNLVSNCRIFVLALTGTPFLMVHGLCPSYVQNGYDRTWSDGKINLMGAPFR